VAVFQPESIHFVAAGLSRAHPVEQALGGLCHAAGLEPRQHFNRVAGFDFERISSGDCGLGQHEMRVLHRGQTVGNVIFRLGVEGQGL
jgi:hypothetical protein